MSKSLYVGNLPFSTNDAELTGVFAEFGAVVKASVIIDRETGRSKGFGFVEMEQDQEALTAAEALNGRDYNGRNLKVNEARPKEPRQNNGGGYGRYPQDNRQGGRKNFNQDRSSRRDDYRY